MNRLLTIGFEFSDLFYYALVRVKERNDHTEYQITVMNGNLEQMLYGSHILKEVEGCLQIEICDDSEKAKLKMQIAQSLGQFLHIPLTEISHN